MLIIMGMILILVGLLMLIKPALFWSITESWKSNDATEPSDLYLFSTRFGGALVLLAGIGGVVIFLLQ